MDQPVALKGFCVHCAKRNRCQILDSGSFDCPLAKEYEERCHPEDSRKGKD